jgi:hypothetical protein
MAIAGGSRALFASTLALTLLLELGLPNEDPERWLALLLAAMVGPELSSSTSPATTPLRSLRKPRCCSVTSAPIARIAVASLLPRRDARDRRSRR